MSWKKKFVGNWGQLDMKFDDNSLYNIKSSVDGKRYSLFELATWKNGLAFKKINFSETGVPVIKIAELNNGIGGTTAYTQQTFSEDVHLCKGDLLFSWSGNPQTSIDVFRFNLDEGWLNQHIFKVTPDEKTVDRDYFYFLMKNLKPHFTQIATNKQTTGLGHVTIADIKRMSVVIPSLDVQREIVSYIKPIDDKIELNNEINNNLEQQAEALFHSLFVDNANPTWKEGVLSDLGTIVAGGTPSKSKPEYYSEHGIAWITPKDLSLNKSKFISHGEIDISELGFSKSSATKMPAGTVLFSSRAPIGYIAIAVNEVTTNQGFKSVVPNENIGTAFMYYLLKFLLPTIEGMASGSTFKEISGAGMKTVPVVIPDNMTIEKFNSFCTPIFQQQEVLESENSRLADIRDSLLSKLMSGEIDVSNIDL